MTAALIITAALALVAVIGLVVVLVVGARLRPAPKISGRTVVINTRRPDDQTIRGVIHGQYADRWTLRDAILITPIGEQPMQGLQHIPVANIAFVQELTEPMRAGDS